MQNEVSAQFGGEGERLFSVLAARELPRLPTAAGQPLCGEGKALPISAPPPPELPPARSCYIPPSVPGQQPRTALRAPQLIPVLLCPTVIAAPVVPSIHLALLLTATGATQTPI